MKRTLPLAILLGASLAGHPGRAQTQTIPVPPPTWEQDCVQTAPGTRCNVQLDPAAGTGRVRFSIGVSSPRPAVDYPVIPPGYGYIPGRAFGYGFAEFSTEDVVPAIDDELAYTFDMRLDQAIASTWYAFPLQDMDAQVFVGIEIRGIDCDCYGQWGAILARPNDIGYPNPGISMRVRVPVAPATPDATVQPGRFRVRAVFGGYALLGVVRPSAGYVNADLDATLVSITRD